MEKGSFFQETNYRNLLKARQKSLSQAKSFLTWRWLAQKIGLQSTYLSRFLNTPTVHLNEDHLFQLLDLLQFSSTEIDYILALRGVETAQSLSRQKYYEEKMAAIRSDVMLKARRQKPGQIEPSTELSYLTDPHTVLLYVGLHVERWRRSPVVLGQLWGLSNVELVLRLDRLEKLGLIRVHHEPLCVEMINENPIHYSKEHPLMRVYQQLLRTICSTHLMKLTETKKTQFMVTFTSDQNAQEEITKQFQSFIQEIEQIASKYPSEHLYQLNFDFFEWG